VVAASKWSVRNMATMSVRQTLMAKKTAMAEDRESFETVWQEVATYIKPRSLRWIEDSPTQRGGKAHQKIIDPTASLATRTLVSGLNSSTINPSRPWQVYRANTTNMDDDTEFRAYLAKCEEIDRDVILQSNFYAEAAKFTESSVLFGTAAMMLEQDDDRVFRGETFTVGSYYLGKSSRGKIDEFLRVYSDSAKNIVSEFGAENCSPSLVRASEDARSASNKYEILHYIGPNDKYDPKKKFDKTARTYKSCYLEVGPSGHGYSNRDTSYNQMLNNDDKLLRESGYNRFPVLVHRWSADGQDTWGSDYPAALALGHVKELQKLRKMIMQGVELSVKPTLQGPIGSKNSQVQMLPGYTNYVDQNNGGLRPIHEVRPDLQGSMGYGEDIRSQIKDIFFTNLFLMMADNRRSGTKAREIEELHQEKMTLLAPVLERFTDEFLDPFSNQVFDLVEEAGLHPIAPPEFQGRNIDIEYINILATTLKMQGIATLDRALAITGQVGSGKPEALDNLDADAYLRQYYSALNVDARVLNSKDKVAAIREQRAAAEQQQAVAQQMQATIDGAKTLSETKLNEDNALDSLLRVSQGGPR
jgi:hypothetical protein